MPDLVPLALWYQYRHPVGSRVVFLSWKSWNKGDLRVGGAPVLNSLSFPAFGRVDEQLCIHSLFRGILYHSSSVSQLDEPASLWLSLLPVVLVCVASHSLTPFQTRGVVVFIRTWNVIIIRSLDVWILRSGFLRFSLVF